MNYDQKQRIDDIDADDRQFVGNLYENRQSIDDFQKTEDSETSDLSGDMVIYDDVIVDLPPESDEMMSENTSTQDGRSAFPTTADVKAPLNSNDVGESLHPVDTDEKRHKHIPLEVNVLNCTEVEQKLTPVPTPLSERKTVRIAANTAPTTNNDAAGRTTLTDVCHTSAARARADVGPMVDEILSQRLRELKTTDVTDGGCRQNNTTATALSPRQHSEDRSFTQAPHKVKKEKPKKKKKLNFLSKVFRGPWEGWESD